MRRHTILRSTVLLSGCLAAVSLATALPAQAQFPLDPRALLGRMTAPLRQMLPHPPRPRTVSREPSRRDEAAEPELGRLGLVGPLTWPTAYEDVIGYTFWPKDYEDAYRQHGFSDITLAIVMPTDNAPPPEARRRAETTGSAANDAASANACTNTPVQNDWPKAQIAQTVQLDGSQRNALDRLQTTINSAAKSVRASACRDVGALSPPDRLEANVQRLWAVQNATVVIRGALKNFYDTLSDEQKAKFRAAPEPQPADTKNSSQPMGRLQQACAQGADDDRLVKQIQRNVRPTPQQKASVEMLAKTSGGMAQYLMASCMQPTPDDPLARLDSANGRLTAINYAATTMEIALNQLYGALNDEQRKRFEALGR